MDIKEFQNKLKELLELAMRNGRHLHAEIVEASFQEEELNESQMQKVYDYLSIQGVHVDGRDTRTVDITPISKEETREETKENQPACFTHEEQEYLEDYKAILQAVKPADEEEREVLFQKARTGEEAAKHRLAELYMDEVYEIALELHREEIFIGDMIAEGNVGLLTGLEMLEEAEDAHTFLRGEIRNAILFMLEEQTDQKEQEDILVEKVRNLEAKIKELTEDDKNMKYSVEEISAFLDMDVEEIRAVLRLTGDDK